jgi:hypothetical protein
MSDVIPDRVLEDALAEEKHRRHLGTGVSSGRYIMRSYYPALGRASALARRAGSSTCCPTHVIAAEIAHDGSAFASRVGEILDDILAEGMRTATTQGDEKGSGGVPPPCRRVARRSHPSVSSASQFEGPYAMSAGWQGLIASRGPGVSVVGVCQLTEVLSSGASALLLTATPRRRRVFPVGRRAAGVGEKQVAGGDDDRAVVGSDGVGPTAGCLRGAERPRHASEPE